jgi:hypothetical protein
MKDAAALKQEVRYLSRRHQRRILRHTMLVSPILTLSAGLDWTTNLTNVLDFTR